MALQTHTADTDTSTSGQLVMRCRQREITTCRARPAVRYAITCIWRCFFQARAKALRPLSAGFRNARSCCRKCGLSRSGSGRGDGGAGAFGRVRTVTLVRRGRRAIHLHQDRKGPKNSVLSTHKQTQTFDLTTSRPPEIRSFRQCSWCKHDVGSRLRPHSAAPTEMLRLAIWLMVAVLPR